MSERPSVTKHLSNDEYGLFLLVYSKHLQAMGERTREKYSVDKIERIERNLEKQCLEVHFVNGDWWHYTVDGAWY